MCVPERCALRDKQTKKVFERSSRFVGDDSKRCLVLQFAGARLPTEESLLASTELQACREGQFQGSFFFRVVVDTDFQVSTSHSLPSGGENSGVVMVFPRISLETNDIDLLVVYFQKLLF